MHLVTRVTLALLALVLSACAAAPSPGASGGGSSVEVFGTIDAGVSHTSTRTNRR